MKVLIFTASTGGGHKRAAAAIKEKFIDLSTDNQVLIVDGIALSGKLYNSFICEGYTFLAKKTPVFYGKIYKESDKKSPLNAICNNANTLHGYKILPIIEEFKPDVIISCHAFTSTMLGDLTQKGKIDVPIISLITDFAPHRTYLAEGVKHYVVSTQEMVNIIEGKYNFTSATIYPYGIPVFDKFSEEYDRTQLCQQLNLDPNKKTLLFMAGSFGVNDVLTIYEDISKKCTDCQFIVITGNNEHLYHRFENVITDNTLLKMFVDNVEDYMHCSDLIITKPGGLTVSESLQCNLPMAIYSAFPGQEADNADFLVRYGVAILLKENYGESVNELIHNSQKLEKMKENCKSIRPENSAEKIYYLAEKLHQEYIEEKQ